MAKTGRPKVKIDWENAQKMAAIHCTAKEICDVLGISDDTMLRACKKMHGITFAEWIDQKRGPGKLSLRRLQWQTAQSGNVTMQIWLGKQWLDQSDKISNTLESGKSLTDFIKSLRNDSDGIKMVE